MITSLHLEDWKSFERSTLFIDPLTVLIGANASGKSNALDALSFLNRIATGKMLTAALQGDTGLPALRGGIEWAARKPGKVFSLSLVSKSDESMDYEYRLECRVSDNRCDLQAEQLTRIKYRIGKNNTRKSEVGRIMLIRTDPCAEDSPTIVAERIEVPKIQVTTGQIGVTKGGVVTTAVGVAEEQVKYTSQAVPDLLAYLQNETELTRSTLVRILKASGRLDEFFNNPQRFMDAMATILRHELHRLLVDGIKYERIDGVGLEAEWEMRFFEEKDKGMINLLTALKVKNSVYEYVQYDSEVEREFAKRLDEREDIKLFVKLPAWFVIDTPVGTYNPDWAILKHDGQALYLVRETKGTKDFLKLRTSEADKVRCGKKHFETLGVPFAVVVTADEV